MEIILRGTIVLAMVVFGRGGVDGAGQANGIKFQVG